MKALSVTITNISSREIDWPLYWKSLLPTVWMTRNRKADSLLLDSGLLPWYSRFLAFAYELHFSSARDFFPCAVHISRLSTKKTKMLFILTLQESILICWCKLWILPRLHSYSSISFATVRTCMDNIVRVIIELRRRGRRRLHQLYWWHNLRKSAAGRKSLVTQD